MFLTVCLKLPKPAYLLFTVFLLIILTGCSESVRKVQPRFTKGPELSSADIAGGEATLPKKSPEELLAVGYYYLAAGNNSMARLHFVYALKQNPQMAEAYIGLGDIGYHEGDYAGALASYKKAEEQQQNSLDAILGQARALRQLGKLNEANALVSRAMKIAPNDSRVLNELALGYELQGEVRLAAELYREIAQETPDQAAPFNNIGVNLISQGKYSEAIINLSKAFLLNENDNRVKNNLAMAFALYGQEDQALKLFTKTVGEAGAWNNLGYLYMTQGRYDDAERALNKSLELNPKFYVKAQENLDRLKHLREIRSPSLPK